MLSKYNSRGFTLIELLVVIVVLGILAAIVNVSWNGAQNTAKQNAAKSTLAQAKLKLSDYYTDTATYPINKTAICDQPTYAVVPSGDLYRDLCTNPNQAYYLYTASPASCDNSATKCTSYLLTAQKIIWNGTADETLAP